MSLLRIDYVIPVFINLKGEVINTEFSVDMTDGNTQYICRVLSFRCNSLKICLKIRIKSFDSYLSSNVRTVLFYPNWTTIFSTYEL